MKNAYLRDHAMPTESLEQGLIQLQQAAQQGIIAPEEAVREAQAMVMRAQQSAQPVIPRPLDPALDVVIDKPYTGAHVFDETVGEGIKAGAIGLAAKFGVETLLPKMMVNHVSDPAAAEALRQTVLKIDQKTVFGAEKAILNEVKGFLGGFSRGSHKTASELLEKISLSGNLGNHIECENIIQAINNKMRVEVSPGAKVLMTAAVAAVVIGGAYKGYHDAVEAKQHHEDLRNTAAGTREDYAELYNHASDLASRASALESNYAAPAYDRQVRAQLEQAYNAPMTVVTEPNTQSQGVALSAPSASASRAEVLDFQRQQAAMAQNGAPMMG
jgi:hypothetical protein